MTAEELKKIKCPQITQITQTSSEASDTAKDRTVRRRTLEPVQDTGRSYQHRTAAKLGQNDLGEWISSVVPDFLTPACDSPESEICVICVICGYLIFFIANLCPSVDSSVVRFWSTCELHSCPFAVALSRISIFAPSSIWRTVSSAVSP
jgi:hypothetical protein